MTVDAPAKGYWYSPKNAVIIGTFEASGGNQTFETPPFVIDLALLITPDGAPDIDHDGIPNDTDLDDDNDGVPGAGFRLTTLGIYLLGGICKKPNINISRQSAFRLRLNQKYLPHHHRLNQHAFEKGFLPLSFALLKLNQKCLQCHRN